MQEGIQDNLKQWEHDNIDEFKLWELREFASKYFYDRIDNSIVLNHDMQKLITQFPKIKFITMDMLRTNFQQTINDILIYFNITVKHWENIENIYSTWITKQAHIQKDYQIDQIVKSLIDQTFLDWQEWNLTFIDEFIIQRRLADMNINIKCYNLNTFPTNTNELLPLLEKQ